MNEKETLIKQIVYMVFLIYLFDYWIQELQNRKK